jgi:hypothetical protein
MTQNKTQPTGQPVRKFLASLPSEQARADCEVLLKLMQAATGEPPKMWGTSIVGFGDHHYRYASGREGDWFVTGFAPRKQNLTLYVMGGYERQAALLKKLGKHKLGVGCLYLKRLSDVDPATLEQLIRKTVADAQADAAPQPKG